MAKVRMCTPNNQIQNLLVIILAIVPLDITVLPLLQMIFFFLLVIEYNQLPLDPGVEARH